MYNIIIRVKVYSSRVCAQTKQLLVRIYGAVYIKTQTQRTEETENKYANFVYIVSTPRIQKKWFVYASHQQKFKRTFIYLYIRYVYGYIIPINISVLPANIPRKYRYWFVFCAVYCQFFEWGLFHGFEKLLYIRECMQVNNNINYFSIEINFIYIRFNV